MPRVVPPDRLNGVVIGAAASNVPSEAAQIAEFLPVILHVCHGTVELAGRERGIAVVIEFDDPLHVSDEALKNRLNLLVLDLF